MLNWTKIGEPEVGEHRERFADAIARLPWQSLPCELGMMPGENIKAVVKALRIPKVSHVAVSNELAPFGLYGIRGHYANGTAQVYVLDIGTECVPVASELLPEVAA